ncbi:TPA: GGDEF domain-containing protein, partial [Escherichia coli]
NMFMHKKNLRLVFILFFLLISSLVVFLYISFVKEKLSSYATTLVDSGISLYNTSEYRRLIEMDVIRKANMTNEQFINFFHESYSAHSAPDYFFDIGPFLLTRGACINVKDNVDLFCNELVKNIIHIYAPDMGVVTIHNEKYIYYAYQANIDSVLIFLMNPGDFINRLSKKIGGSEGVSVSLYYKNKEMVKTPINTKNLVYSTYRSTEVYPHVLDMLIEFGYSKKKFILTCSFLVFASAILSFLLYFSCVYVFNKLLDDLNSEKKSILSKSNFHPPVKNTLFSKTEIIYLRELYLNSLYDELTRASTRKKFDADILYLSENNGFLCFFDIDGFKKINDSLGHLFGDEVLVRVVCLIKSSLPEESGNIYRLGGDEFAIIYRKSKACDLIEILNKVVSFNVGGLECSCSIGVSNSKECNYDNVKMKLLADERLYKSKEKGKKQITIS